MINDQDPYSTNYAEIENSSILNTKKKKKKKIRENLENNSQNSFSNQFSEMEFNTKGNKPIASND